MRQLLAMACAFACGAALAQAREVHGASDAFADDGITVVWAVLRGATEGDAQVVLRVGAKPETYDQVEGTGVDPFTRDRTARFAATRLAPSATIRLPRAGFGEHPRTELEFTGRSGRLVVYYLGVPDTAPEFADADLMEAYLRQRSGKLR